MNESVTKRALLVASLFAVCLLVASPFTSATHNHIGDDSKDKCVACHHAFLSLDPSEFHSNFGFGLLALGAFDFSGESEAISRPHIANSVRAPPVA